MATQVVAIVAEDAAIGEETRPTRPLNASDAREPRTGPKAAAARIGARQRGSSAPAGSDASAGWRRRYAAWRRPFSRSCSGSRRQKSTKPRRRTGRGVTTSSSNPVAHCIRARTCRYAELLAAREPVSLLVAERLHERRPRSAQLVGEARRQERLEEIVGEARRRRRMPAGEVLLLWRPGRPQAAEDGVAGQADQRRGEPEALAEALGDEKVCMQAAGGAPP